MDSHALECYRQAGNILASVRRQIHGIVREDMNVLDLCERIETLIRENGGLPAFPTNVSINDVAAHYTSPEFDKTRIPWGAVVKVDFGAHVDGYIADTAVSVCFKSELQPLVKAAEEALKVALENIKPNVRASEVGAVIERTIKNYGLKPISNLTGHRVDRFVIHTGKAVPNIGSMNGSKIERGEVYAVEPFVTTAAASGRVVDGATAYIYRFNREKGARTRRQREILDFIRKSYSSLPFASRWLCKAFSPEAVTNSLAELLASRCIMAYPVLIESSRKPVAQAEHTVLITDNGCSALTE